MNLGFVCATCNSSRWCGRPCKSDPNKTAPWEEPAPLPPKLQKHVDVAMEKIETVHQKLAELHPTVRPKWKRPLKSKNTTLKSIRLDNDVLDHFMSSGPGWQTRINAILRGTMK